MTPFEIGFAEGERKRCDDIKTGRIRVAPTGDLSPRARGFWMGYTPRSQTWALRATPARSFHETEHQGNT